MMMFLHYTTEEQKQRVKIILDVLFPNENVDVPDPLLRDHVKWF
jgi:hypothetical protein